MQVRDICGGLTSVLRAPTLAVMPAGADGSRRRQLTTSGNFWAIAQARVQSALQTFQPGETNQLAMVVALQMAVLSPGSAAAALESTALLQSLTDAASQAVLTSGYVCEALGAAAVVAGSRSADLGSDSIISGATLLDKLIRPPFADGGSVSSACSASAVTAFGGLLLAVRRNSSFVLPTATAKLADSLKNGMGGFLLRGLEGAAVGERRENTVAGILIASASRTEVVIPVNERFAGSAQIFDLMLPSLSFGAGSVILNVPLLAAVAAAGLADQNSTTAIVDIAVQVLAIAPGQLAADLGTLDFVSPAASVSISVSAAAAVDSSQSMEAIWLDQLEMDPILITIPVNPIAHFSESANSTFCVAWNGSVYSTESCSVHAISISGDSVTCACKLLSLIAVVGKTSSGSVIFTTVASSPVSSPPKSNEAAFAAIPSEELQQSTQTSQLPLNDANFIPPIVGSRQTMAPLAAYASAGVGVLGLAVLVAVVNRLRVAWRLVCSTRQAKKPSLKQIRRHTVTATSTRTKDFSMDAGDAESDRQWTCSDSLHKVKRWAAASSSTFSLKTDLVLIEKHGDATPIPLNRLDTGGLTGSAGWIGNVSRVSEQQPDYSRADGARAVVMEADAAFVYAPCDVPCLKSWRGGLMQSGRDPVVLNPRPPLPEAARHRAAAVEDCIESTMPST